MEVRLSCRKSAIGSLLSTAHKIQWSPFSRNHTDWEAEDWKRILFCGRARASLESLDGRKKYGEETEENFKTPYLSKEEKRKVKHVLKRYLL